MVLAKFFTGSICDFQKISCFMTKFFKPDQDKEVTGRRCSRCAGRRRSERLRRSPRGTAALEHPDFWPGSS